MGENHGLAKWLERLINSFWATKKLCKLVSEEKGNSEARHLGKMVMEVSLAF